MKPIAFGFLLALAGAAGAGATVASSAVDITGSSIDIALQRTAEQPDADESLGIYNVGNDYNLGISVVHRARTGGRQIPPAAVHNEVTEVFHIIAGTGTMVTGGTLAPPQQNQNDPRSGPTILGSRIVDGITRGVGPGDVIVVPPNTPVQFTEINSGQLVYLVVRIDPHKVLASR